MADKTIPDFIIIDDDPISNMICSKSIEKLFHTANNKTFTNPLSGLDCIFLKYKDADTYEAFLFLDINMPVLNGWGVLDKFNDFPDAIKKHFNIYILSSSVENKDKQLALENPLVSGYIKKPLTAIQLLTIFPDAQSS